MQVLRFSCYDMFYLKTVSSDSAVVFRIKCTILHLVDEPFSSQTFPCVRVWPLWDSVDYSSLKNIILNFWLTLNYNNF